MKKIIIVFFAFLFIFSPVSYVSAENIFSGTDEASEFDYSEEDFVDEDNSVDTTENEVESGEKLGKQFEKKNSFGIVLIEIFCGLVGVFMLYLSFKIKES